MEPWPVGRGVRGLAESGRRLRISRGLPGFGPVEPHTEVADHERVYDGDGGAGRARTVDPACGGACRRAARGALVGLRRGGGRAAVAPLAVRALLLRGGPDGVRPLPLS